MVQIKTVKVLSQEEDLIATNSLHDLFVQIQPGEGKKQKLSTLHTPCHVPQAKLDVPLLYFPEQQNWTMVSFARVELNVQTDLKWNENYTKTRRATVLQEHQS